jgi:hypothetical protein
MAACLLESFGHTRSIKPAQEMWHGLTGPRRPRQVKVHEGDGPQKLAAAVVTHYGLVPEEGGCPKGSACLDEGLLSFSFSHSSLYGESI